MGMELIIYRVLMLARMQYHCADTTSLRLADTVSSVIESRKRLECDFKVTGYCDTENAYKDTRRAHTSPRRNITRALHQHQRRRRAAL